MLDFFQTYKTPILQAVLSISLYLLLTFLKLPIFLLHNLHTYIHPDNVAQQNGVKAAIRRPSSSVAADSDAASHPLRRRNRSKEKFEFDENKAQIFRLKLDEGHLQSRIYFNDCWYSFVYFSVSVSCFLVYKYFDDDDKKIDENTGILVNGSLFPVVLGVLSLCKLILSLGKVSLEKSASRRSEKQLSVVVGILGFVIGLVICSGNVRFVLDFDFGSVDGFGKIFVAVLMGCLAGFFYMAAAKNARSFWLGTDQVRSNLDIISSGWFARTILYANLLLVFFTALLWIKPLTDILVNTNKLDHIKDAEQLVGNVGFKQSEFTSFRLWCLLFSGVFQFVALRPNLQMYLNEALLSWYQRLHASKVPDLEFSRAKIFLHNHYLCLAVLQFYSPAILVLLFLGLSQIDGNSFRNFQFLCGLLPCTAFAKEVTLFLAWWVVFIWAVFTSMNLLFYRLGTFYIS